MSGEGLSKPERAGSTDPQVQRDYYEEVTTNAKKVVKDSERQIKSARYQHRLAVIKGLEKLLGWYSFLVFVFILGGSVGRNDIVWWSLLALYWLGFVIVAVLDITKSKQ